MWMQKEDYRKGFFCLILWSH